VAKSKLGHCKTCGQGLFEYLHCAGVACEWTEDEPLPSRAEAKAARLRELQQESSKEGGT